MTDSDSLEDIILPKMLETTINGLFEEYVFDIMRRGLKFKYEDKKYGCGCPGCYIDGKKMYEWAFPEISPWLAYEDIPTWLFIKEKRQEYRETHGNIYLE